VENRELVLLVEDSDDDALMLRRAFKKAGIVMPLAHVKSGSQAIRYLQGAGDYGNRTVHPLPKFVLLDLGLPEMDGYEVLVWIREQADLRPLPVIVLTGLATGDGIVRAYQLGANSFLVKSAEFEEVVKMIRALSDFWLHTAATPVVGKRKVQTGQKTDPITGSPKRRSLA